MLQRKSAYSEIRHQTARGWYRIWTWSVALLLCFSSGSRPATAQGNGNASGHPLTPLSGDDGVFETVQEGGKTAWQSVRERNGSYSLYIYFRIPEAVRSVAGPVYVEVLYKDAGAGSMGLQYNARGS